MQYVFYTVHFTFTTACSLAMFCIESDIPVCYWCVDETKYPQQLEPIPLCRSVQGLNSCGTKTAIDAFLKLPVRTYMASLCAVFTM